MASQSLHVPQSSAMPAQRPVSVAVQPSTASPTSRRQQRASHSVTSSSAQAQDSSAYQDVFHHPAVEAYTAAHPRRTIPRFGPYLLLQTLGEGEFGKVKLGIHVQWGEEVAVKLIRRGNVDNAVRLSKVEREIEVLRTLKHPNIVRLYDVIETDKYIGIILEYASGGELFDHILAHRYLKERDAAKLFSQLISGVWYIHQKKIVHRDLKLENLLLDRNRNVIITDFGFANRFEHKADDLMQTSCGSPCYAAPELVISEGLYVGSAVDIWSCGVILYAMLAGYLPFDDDPANPDGDNINLLYKYIVSTPLSFPDYISQEARDLLGMMLVPDPTRRANLDSVMRHRWLAAHAGTPRTDGSPNAFGKSVEELERAALEQHQQRRLAYQRQMRAAAIGQNTSNPKASSHGRETTHTGIPSRTQSNQPEYIYESSADQSHPAPPVAARSNTAGPAPTATATPNGVKRPPTHGSPSAQGITPDDPFGPPPPAPNAATGPNAAVTDDKAATTTKGHKQNTSSGGGGFRHTIQVEYDDRNNSGRRSEERRTRAGTDYHQQQQPAQPNKDRRVSGSAAATTTTKPLPVSPTATTTATSATSTSPPPPPAKNNTTPSSSPSHQKQSGTTRDLPKVSTSATATSSNSQNVKDKDKETSSNASGTESIGKKTGSGVITPTKTQGQGHKKGRSSVDKFAFSKLFGGSGASGNNGGSGGTSTDALSPTPTLTPGAAAAGASAASSVLSGSPEKIVDGKEKDKEKDATGKKTRRNTLTIMVEPISRTIRGRATKNKAGTLPPEHQAQAPSPALSSSAANASAASLAPPGLSSSPSSGPGVNNANVNSKGNVKTSSATSFGGASVGSGQLDAVGGEGEGGNGNAASTSKAQKVMAWFRTKSKGRDSLSVGVSMPRDTSRSSGGSPAVGGDDDDGMAVAGGEKNKPALTLTTPTSTTTKLPPSQPQTPGVHTPAAPPGVVAPGHPKRSASTNTESSSVMTFSTQGFVQKFRNSVGVGSSSTSSRKHASQTIATPSRSHTTGPGMTPPSSAGKQKQKHPHEKLRIHHGAVDQTTITTRPPAEVMKHVKEILEGMGMEMVVESEFKYRCVRVKKKKGAVSGSVGSVRADGAGAGGIGGEEGADVAVLNVVGSAASNGVDKRGLPMPSQTSFSTTGNMLRGLLMRRQSSQVSQHNNNNNASTPAPNGGQVAFDDENSVVISPPAPISDSPVGVTGGSGPGDPVYGDPTQDAGDEVRFSVELTRIDRLNDTFSLDIRRLKGNLRSYKFLYDSIRQRADLQRLGQ